MSDEEATDADCLIPWSEAFDKYKDVMFKTWLAKNADANRGFKEVKKGDETISAEEQSALVQDMLESITSYLPHIASKPIINNAVSLEWVLEYLKTHLGLSNVYFHFFFVTFKHIPN